MTILILTLSVIPCRKETAPQSRRTSCPVGRTASVLTADYCRIPNSLQRISESIRNVGVCLRGALPPGSDAEEGRDAGPSVSDLLEGAEQNPEAGQESIS